MHKTPVAVTASRRFIYLVGLAGLEPATSRPPDGRATRLRYSPNIPNCLTKSDQMSKSKKGILHICFKFTPARGQRHNLLRRFLMAFSKLERLVFNTFDFKGLSKGVLAR